ncbi:MAG: hypothetical protein ACOX7H_02530 [Bacillota bacterium]|jgi:hypothetical protein
MKIFLLFMVILICFILGLNATAAGMHSLLPDAPDIVVGLVRENDNLVFKFLQYNFRF